MAPGMKIIEATFSDLEPVELENYLFKSIQQYTSRLEESANKYATYRQNHIWYTVVITLIIAVIGTIALIGIKYFTFHETIIYGTYQNIVYAYYIMMFTIVNIGSILLYKMFSIRKRQMAYLSNEIHIIHRRLLRLVDVSSQFVDHARGNHDARKLIVYEMLIADAEITLRFASEVMPDQKPD